MKNYYKRTFDGAVFSEETLKEFLHRYYLKKKNFMRGLMKIWLRETLQLFPELNIREN